MITHLYHYPVKGLSGEPLKSLDLIAGEGIPGDRAIAITREPGVFDPAAPKASSKMNFLMLAKDEALAALTTRYDSASRALHISKNGDELMAASTETVDGRTALAAFFVEYLGKDELAPEIASAPGHKFTDISVVSVEKMRAISLINLASVRALEEAIGQPVDHRRFRANIYFDGVPAWEEFNWLEKDLILGKAKALPTSRTRRCPATQVNPETAARDINIPAELRKHFGHFDMGIYAEAQSTGIVSIDDAITPVSR